MRSTLIFTLVLAASACARSQEFERELINDVVARIPNQAYRADSLLPNDSDLSQIQSRELQARFLPILAKIFPKIKSRDLDPSVQETAIRTFLVRDITEKQAQDLLSEITQTQSGLATRELHARFLPLLSLIGQVVSKVKGRDLTEADLLSSLTEGESGLATRELHTRFLPLLSLIGQVASKIKARGLTKAELLSSLAENEPGLATRELHARFLPLLSLIGQVVSKVKGRDLTEADLLTSLTEGGSGLETRELHARFLPLLSLIGQVVSKVKARSPEPSVKEALAHTIFSRALVDLKKGSLTEEQVNSLRLALAQPENGIATRDLDVRYTSLSQLYPGLFGAHDRSRPVRRSESSEIDQWRELLHARSLNDLD